MNVHEAAGGTPFFLSLADAFYRRVAADPLLLELYPEPGDLPAASRRLGLFLAQYFGGPTTYSDERGHPRLRMRHFPYSIGPTERDHWLAAMRTAIDELGPAPEVRDSLESYFAMAAEAMRNRD